jgi:hypothetical protein
MIRRSPITTVLLLAFSGLLSAEPATQPSLETVLQKAAEEGRKSAEHYIEYLDPIVSLSDEQKAAITDINIERSKALAQYEFKWAARLEEFRQHEIERIFFERGTPYKDPEKAARIEEESRTAYAPLQEAYDKLREREDRVLTFPQKAKLKDHILTDRIQLVANPIKLSSQQIKVAIAALTAIQLPNENAQYHPNDIFRAAVDAMTRDQKIELFKYYTTDHVKFWSEGLDLSADQLQKAQALCDQIAQNSETWNQPFRDTRKSLGESFHNLLTPEQKEKALKNQHYPLNKDDGIW